ncbi:MAG TPA: anti-sigma factor [Gaiellaceae bacterium]|nr:anti-sigma factor [Gaiellaceae bacterium]
MTDRFDELVGEVDDPQERARLLRVHELLLSVDAPPDVAARPLRLRPRRDSRRLALLAAALAVAVAATLGYAAGSRDDGPAVFHEIARHGVGVEQGSTATIEVLDQDAGGNWPMLLLVRGLEPSTDRDDAYELWLTRDGELADSCGVFTVHEGLTTVTLSVPFALRSYDGWVVTRRGSDQVLLTT